MFTQITNHNLQKTQTRQLHWRRLLLTLVLSMSLVLPTVSNAVALYAQSATAATSTSPTTLRAIVSAESATLQTEPGGETLRTLTPGTAVVVQQRTADGQWVLGETTDGPVGWLATEQLILFGVEKLPVVAKTAVGTATAPVTATARLTETTFAPMETSTIATEATTQAVTITGALTIAPNAEVATPSAAHVMATVAVTEGRLNARSGPATDYRIIAKLTQGETFVVIGQSADSQWVLLDLADDTQGWASATYVIVSGSLDSVPVTAVVVRAAAAIPAPVGATNVSSSATDASTNSQPTGSVTGLHGTLVFQASQGGDIYAYYLVSGELRRLTSGFDPAISPDGTQVAFTRAGTDGGLFLINLDGSNERKIYGEGNNLRSPQWSPDGKWLVFSRTSGTWTCYLLGPDCATRQQLVSGLPPTVANDPKTVAQFLAGFDTRDNLNYGIARVSATGDDYRDLAALDTARTPDWGANGIVYQSTAGLQKTADQPDAANSVVVAGPSLQDPDWQPNGDRIVYQARRGDHWEIFSVNPDGSGAVALTQPVTTLVDQLPSNGSPTWSPDGQHLVFLSNRTDNHEAGAWRLWVMNADGSNPRPLPIDVALVYSFNGEQMVSWGR